MASSVGSRSRHNSRYRNQPDQCILSIRLHCRCHRRTNRPRWLRQELEGFGGAVILDGSGKFLIPALWDMRVRIENPDRDFPMIVANEYLAFAIGPVLRRTYSAGARTLLQAQSSALRSQPAAPSLMVLTPPIPSMPSPSTTPPRAGRRYDH